MYLDIFIYVIIGFALVRGFLNGFIKEIASAVGFFLGLLVALTCYEQFGEYLKVDGSEVNMFTSIVAFLLLWIVVPIVFGFLANLLTKAIDKTSLSFINRLLGGVVSVVKFVVLLSCVLNVMAELRILNAERTEDSVMAAPVQSVTIFLMDKAPEYVPKVQEFVDTVFIERSIPIQVEQ